MPVSAAAAELRRILDTDPLSAIAEATTKERAGGQWSRKQILGHLIDSASNNHQRFVRAQVSPGSSFPKYQQEEWVAAQLYADRPWLELVALWAAYNRHLLHLMEVAPQPATIRVGDAEPVTLEFLMTDYVRHLKHHLDQILSR